MTTSAKAWRDLVQEEALDPDLPIIDAHHHIWTSVPMPVLETWTPEEFFADKVGCGHRIVATVEVDCHQHYRTSGPERLRVLGETEYMEDVAREGLRRGGGYAGACAAIIPHADLLEGAAVGEVLDAHRAVSPRVAGIRYITAFEDSLPRTPAMRTPGLMQSQKFREGFAEIVKRGMTFDAWLFQTQLNEVDDLARAFPDAKIILDGSGGPFVLGRYEGRAAEAFDDWKKALKKVAAHPNIFIKISALNMPNPGVSAIGLPRPRSSAETAEVQKHYILAAIDIFGPARCMFASNFPVDMRGISYGVLWNTFKRVTAGFSTAERADMFWGVAMRTYHIDAL